MKMWFVLLWTLVACWGENHRIVEGVVVEVHPPYEVVVDHKEIPGFMGAMVMPFAVDDPEMVESLKPGDRILARLRLEGSVATLEKVRVTGSGPVPALRTDGPEPVRPGGILESISLQGASGEPLRVGQGQGLPTVLTFVYTRCPMPEFCPATVLKLQALQAVLPGESRIVVVTVDPDFDSVEVLRSYGEANDAGPRWLHARTEPEATAELAIRAGLPVAKDDEGTVVHGIRYLVLSGEGRLIERYDDHNWSLDRVVEQLNTGSPHPPPGVVGTVTAPPSE